MRAGAVLFLVGMLLAVVVLSAAQGIREGIASPSVSDATPRALGLMSSGQCSAPRFSLCCALC